jgi:hypothetical protein
MKRVSPHLYWRKQMNSDKNCVAPKVWLITGSSTGFGYALAEAVLKKGDSVQINKVIQACEVVYYPMKNHSVEKADD